MTVEEQIRLWLDVAKLAYDQGDIVAYNAAKQKVLALAKIP